MDLSCCEGYVRYTYWAVAGGPAAGGPILPRTHIIVEHYGMACLELRRTLRYGLRLFRVT